MRADTRCCPACSTPARAGNWRRCTTTTRHSARGSSWQGTISDAANTNTCAIRCRLRSRRCAQALYPRLAPLANQWHRRLRLEPRFPADLDAFLARCHEAGQERPTPLILKYEADDYNCLHQDLYGEHVFPVQATVLLSAPGDDFAGGEFVLVETRPRMQSRAEVVPLGRGDAVLFAVNYRPVAGTRGDYRVAMRHGVSRVREGRRFTLGIIFHDAA